MEVFSTCELGTNNLQSNDNTDTSCRYNSLPVLHANLDHDLLAEAKAGSVAEKTYSFQKKETQFVPVST